ncbi:MAG TPA: BlaI/MecI/CopY family transcriptional regulator [Candidatus Acidoferrum sp.]|nr:BlaI/MecI/CopY family transcriptional regulator [Candidatus Acidoferrum sp.]
MSKQIQISDAEWEIMKVLWQTPGLTANEVTERLADSMEWHVKTVRTMLTRLQNKKVLEAKVVDKLYRYTPLLTRDACTGAASTSFLSRVFDGAFTPMMAHFVKTSPLSKKDRAELERILGKYQKE